MKLQRRSEQQKWQRDVRLEVLRAQAEGRPELGRVVAENLDPIGAFRCSITGERFFLVPSGPVISIGRDRNCEIFVHDPLVSRRAARIEASGKWAEIQDLKSVHGVSVNGERLSGRRILQDGDVVTAGRTEVGRYIALT